MYQAINNLYCHVYVDILDCIRNHPFLTEQQNGFQEDGVKLLVGILIGLCMHLIFVWIWLADLSLKSNTRTRGFNVKGFFLILYSISLRTLLFYLTKYKNEAQQVIAKAFYLYFSSVSLKTLSFSPINMLYVSTYKNIGQKH